MLVILSGVAGAGKDTIKKEIIKLEKKCEKEQNEIEKHILNIKILIMKDIIGKFNFKN